MYFVRDWLTTAFSFCDTRQKERCESTLLLPHGIAKHLYPYNSEAHTSKGTSILLVFIVLT